MAKGLCWTKANKSGAKGAAPRIGATVSADFKANQIYCHSVGGTGFLTLLVRLRCSVALVSLPREIEQSFRPA